MVNVYRIKMVYPEERIVTSDFVIQLANDHKASEAQLEVEKAMRNGYRGEQVNGLYGYRQIYDCNEAAEYLDDEGVASFSGSFS